jgi:hypothetical protein
MQAFLTLTGTLILHGTPPNLAVICIITFDAIALVLELLRVLAKKHCVGTA